MSLDISDVSLLLQFNNIRQVKEDEASLLIPILEQYVHYHPPASLEAVREYTEKVLVYCDWLKEHGRHMEAWSYENKLKKGAPYLSDYLHIVYGHR